MPADRDPQSGIGAGRAAPLVLILDSHRLQHPDLSHRIEPKERVTADVTVNSFSGEVEKRIVERALAETGLDLLAVSMSHRVRSGRLQCTVDENESLRQRGDGQIFSSASIQVVPRSFFADHEAGAGQQVDQLGIVVVDAHVDPIDAQTRRSPRSRAAREPTAERS